MNTWALKISYRGTNYHGWQRQKQVVTVQETLENALFAVSGQQITTVGCGRTDAGVHARMYCVSFRAKINIPAEKLPLALNAHLPEDIVVQAAMIAADDFNAILSCVKKEYSYQILNARVRDPFLSPFSYFYPQKFDLEKVQQAAHHFVGTHDFAAMRSVGTVTKTSVRTVHYFELSQEGTLITMRVCADGFLYNMARAMVGTLLYVAQGKIQPDEIPELLREADRTKAGPTAVAEGLAMTKLWYPDPVGQMFEMA